MSEYSCNTKVSQVFEAMSTQEPCIAQNDKKVRLTTPIFETRRNSKHKVHHVPNHLRRRSAVCGLSPNSSLSIGAVM